MKAPGIAVLAVICPQETGLRYEVNSDSLTIFASQPGIHGWEAGGLAISLFECLSDRGFDGRIVTIFTMQLERDLRV